MLEFRELTCVSAILRLLLAVAVGGALGIERGRKNQPAGLRTYMLVCLGSATVMITNQYIVQSMGTGDPVRMGAQVISGIGFLGAGSIMVTGRNQIRGITTAAGLWAAACIGLAIGIGFYEIGIASGILVFLVLTVLHELDVIARRNSRLLEIYMELDQKESIGGFIHFLRGNGLEISNLQIENNCVSMKEGIAFVTTVKSTQRQNHERMLDILRGAPNLQFVEEL